MAGALGLAASTIAAIQLTASVVSLGYEYVKKAARAPENLFKLVNELKSLHQILTSLHMLAQANPESVALRQLNDPLQECIKEMITLRAKLEPKNNLAWWEAILIRCKWPFEETETSNFISQVERLKSHILLALNIDQISVLKAIGIDVRNIVEALRSESVIQGSSGDYGIGEERTRALNWLYSETFNERHVEINGRRQESTCEWILKRPEVMEWGKKNPNSRLLWGYGIPGAGKTFLSSLMIDNLQKKARTENYGVAYIYFNYKEQSQQSPIRVVSSLVKQLACQIPQLPTEIKDLRSRLEPGQNRPSLGELCAALLAVASVKYFSQTFVVCDALDECDQESQRKQLLPFFHQMRTNGINLFLTSREHPEDIQHSLRHSAKVRLRAHNKDVTSYIERKIADNPRANRLIGQSNHKDEVVSKLTEYANGMFLLVHFLVGHLCKQTTLSEVLGELEKLRGSSAEGRPLDPTYHRAMRILRSQPKNCVKLALKILSWLVKSQKVLTIRELQIAVSVEQGRTTFDEHDLPDKKTLLDVCAGLVTIDDISNTVRLAHYTVQEYLLEHSILPDDADFQLAMACTTFLSFDLFSQGACNTTESLETRLYLYPFIEYAAKNLSFHLKACDEALTTDLILRFLGKPGTISSYLQARSVRREWLRCYTSPGIFGYPGGQTPLHIAVFLGHCSVIRLLLDRINISAVDDRGQTALHLAVDRGNESVVLLLLKEGANISAADQYGKTALHYAAGYGHEPVVLLLLGEGANISVADQYGKAALYYAARYRHESAVLRLLEKGADFSVTDQYGLTTLHYAARYGHESIVLQLLEKGVDISVPDQYGKIALHYAAGYGHESVVLLLLGEGANISVADQYGKEALHYAAGYGHESVVQLLLREGADISVKDQYGLTVVHYAARYGHESVVLLLLEKSADISVADKHGWTALHLAARGGHECVVLLLLENGAEISASNRDGETPLQLAVNGGHESTVRALRQAGPA